MSKEDSTTIPNAQDGPEQEPTVSQEDTTIASEEVASAKRAWEKHASEETLAEEPQSSPEKEPQVSFFKKIYHKAASAITIVTSPVTKRVNEISSSFQFGHETALLGSSLRKYNAEKEEGLIGRLGSAVGKAELKLAGPCADSTTGRFIHSTTYTFAGCTSGIFAMKGMDLAGAAILGISAALHPAALAAVAVGIVYTYGRAGQALASTAGSDTLTHFAKYGKWLSVASTVVLFGLVAAGFMTAAAVALGTLMVGMIFTQILAGIGCGVAAHDHSVIVLAAAMELQIERKLAEAVAA